MTMRTPADLLATRPVWNLGTLLRSGNGMVRRDQVDGTLGWRTADNEFISDRNLDALFDKVEFLDEIGAELAGFAAKHLPRGGSLMNGDTWSQMDCSCGWRSIPGRPDDGLAEWAIHLLTRRSQ